MTYVSKPINVIIKNGDIFINHFTYNALVGVKRIPTMVRWKLLMILMVSLSVEITLQKKWLIILIRILK